MACHSLSCGHLYCGPCLATWLNQNQSCPTCRKPIAGVPVRCFQVRHSRGGRRGGGACRGESQGTTMPPRRETPEPPREPRSPVPLFRPPPLPLLLSCLRWTTQSTTCSRSAWTSCLLGEPPPPRLLFPAARPSLADPSRLMPPRAPHMHPCMHACMRAPSRLAGPRWSGTTSRAAGRTSSRRSPPTGRSACTCGGSRRRRQRRGTTGAGEGGRGP